MSEARVTFVQADGHEWSVPVAPEAADEIRDMTTKAAMTFGVDVRFEAAGEKGSDDE